MRTPQVSSSTLQDEIHPTSCGPPNHSGREGIHSPRGAQIDRDLEMDTVRYKAVPDPFSVMGALGTKEAGPDSASQEVAG